jgi:hypothetical protein
MRSSGVVMGLALFVIDGDQGQPPAGPQRRIVAAALRRPTTNETIELSRTDHLERSKRAGNSRRSNLTRECRAIGRRECASNSSSRNDTSKGCNIRRLSRS